MPERLRMARGALAVLMIAMGVLHFLAPHPFARAVPAYLPYPVALVLISGVFEVAGGAGLLIQVTRKFASFGLIALYLAVFPANINMALHASQWVAPPFQFLFWIRLPFQVLLIAWAWVCR